MIRANRYLYGSCRIPGQTSAAPAPVELLGRLYGRDYPIAAVAYSGYAWSRGSRSARHASAAADAWRGLAFAGVRMSAVGGRRRVSYAAPFNARVG